jgi:hypothetical protein
MQVTNGQKRMSPEEVYRRAGGRRKYNAERQRQAENRRLLVEWRFLQVAEEFLLSKRNPRGWKTRLAAELGVSRMQIGRDFKRLLDQLFPLAETLGANLVIAA